MPLLSKSLITLGVLLLAHACYSAHEHSSLLALHPSITNSPTSSPSTRSPLPTTTHLPLDITLETIVSVLVICVGLVLGAEELKPISWRVWAGRIEREKEVGREGKGGVGGNPFQGLEERVGFMDIRAKRKEFAEWVREGGAPVKS
ncbi:hypothetical protein MMC08_003651 [Hypocenomyce scalaris]|nr:hypothetical protein [Hypocenomyce scalaris]